MVISALDHVPHCYSAEDGDVIHAVLLNAFDEKQNVTLSFSGVYDVPSSFINAALVPFVLAHGSDWLKKKLSIIGVRPQIANMIRRCFKNAEQQMAAV